VGPAERPGPGGRARTRAPSGVVVSWDSGRRRGLGSMAGVDGGGASGAGALDPCLDEARSAAPARRSHQVASPRERHDDGDAAPAAGDVGTGGAAVQAGAGAWPCLSADRVGCTQLHAGDRHPADQVHLRVVPGHGHPTALPWPPAGVLLGGLPERSAAGADPGARTPLSGAPAMTGYRGSHGRERFDLSPGVVARSLYYIIRKRRRA